MQNNGKNYDNFFYEFLHGMIFIRFERDSMLQWKSYKI